MATPWKKIAVILIVLGAGVAWASGDWSAATRKADDVKRRGDELKTLAPQETRKVVAAICEAADDGRKSAADSASSNARSHIADKYNELERGTREAIDLLDRVISDDKLKDKQSDARSLASDLKSRKDKVDELTRNLRNGNHPVVEFMLGHGESARHDRMDRCAAKDIAIGYDRADCLAVSGETCTVIELAADSSRAVSKARDRASRDKSHLEEELKKAASGTGSDTIKRLTNVNRDFAKCKRVESRVDCYKLCPDVSDDNRHREPSPSWRQGC